MKKLGLASVTLLLAILAFSATISHAEEDSPYDSAEELIAPALGEISRGAWKASIDGSWLPQSDSSDAGGKVGMSGTKVNFGHTYQVTPRLTLTPEIIYSLLHVSAPDTARLPESLHTISLALRGDYRVGPKLSFGMLLAPALAGDFKRIGGDDIRVRLGFTGRYNATDKLTLLAGLIYQEGYKSLPVFPIIGGIYRPDEQWTISLAAPRPGVTYAPGKDLRLHLGGEFFGSEYHLNDTTLGAEIIRYRDFRVDGGAEFTIFASLKGELAAGYAFSRKFVFYDVFDATRHDIKVDDGPFARAGLMMEW